MAETKKTTKPEAPSKAVYGSGDTVEESKTTTLKNEAKTISAEGEASTSEVHIQVEPELEAYQLRDTVNNPLWQVVGSKNCAYTSRVLDILSSRGETNIKISYIEDDQRAFQDLTRRGIFYTPAVFAGTEYLGSLGEVENYFKRTFFQDDYNKFR